uniref:hypothetical protein n=1 Tax=Pedobacter schmidteae TaxID=2201271 RepID=UPI000EACED6B|nr:hypothetical protein [Pedobacter schmidteae]
MSNTSSTVQLVEYSRVFDEQPTSLEAYLTGISRKKMLTAASFLLGFYNRESKFDDFRELLEMFFCEENNEFANEVYQKLRANEIQVRVPLKIINPFSALQIFEYSFDHLTDEEVQSNAEAERNIFKAILFQNEVNTTNQMAAFESTEGMSIPYRVPYLAMAQSFPFSELINYDKGEVLAAQIVKSIFLFEFLASNDKTQALLAAFLHYFGCGSWQDYLKRIMPLVLTEIKNPREAHIDIVVEPDEHFQQSCEFIEKLIITSEDAVADYDFKKIRAKPFYKIGEGVYRLIFELFIMEMLYKGLYFKLSEINDTLPKADKIKNLRSFYCDDFSERYLLYTILESIYHKRYIQFTGTEMKESLGSAEPDYYIRNGNTTFLFESKDILINAEVKESFDFTKQEAEFKKKLYFEDKGGRVSNKAVLQLILNIEKCLKMEFPFDMNYKAKNQFIYPIVVLHDHMYKVPGLNYMVNQWYLAELQGLRSKGLNVDRVQPLTIIDIDTFIFHQDILRTQKIRLEDLIDRYHSYTFLDVKKKYADITDAKQKLYNKSVSFSTFLSKYVVDKGLYIPPKMIMEKGISLFNDQKE